MSNNNPIEDLVRELRGNDAETLDVPHPSKLEIETTPITGWHPSTFPADPNEPHKGSEGVRGQIVKVVQLDEYREPVGDPAYDMMHRYPGSGDISSTRISPGEVRNLRKRFPGAFTQFEELMEHRGEDLPIAFLDDVPPEVLYIVKVMGAPTIKDFAAFDEKQMKALEKRLHDHKLAGRARYMNDYRERARAKVGYEPKRGPGRPAKQEAA